MQSSIKNHLVSLFVPIKGEYLLFSETNEYKYHIDAIANIERQLTRYGIEPCEIDYNNISDSAFYHVSEGRILIANASTEESAVFYIYIPEVIDEITNNIIINCICETGNNDFTKTYVMQKKDDTFKYINPQEIVQKVLVKHL